MAFFKSNGSLLILFLLGFGFWSCKPTTISEDLPANWQELIVFDNYLVPDVDSVNTLIKNEKFAFQLFNDFKNMDSLSYFNKYIELDEAIDVYAGQSYKYLSFFDDKIKANRGHCFKQIGKFIKQDNSFDWQKASIQKVTYDVFDIENNKLFVKVIIDIDCNGKSFELKAPDCVYTYNGLKTIQPVHWQNQSCLTGYKRKIK